MSFEKQWGVQYHRPIFSVGELFLFGREPLGYSRVEQFFEKSAFALPFRRGREYDLGHPTSVDPPAGTKNVIAPTLSKHIVDSLRLEDFVPCPVGIEQAGTEIGHLPGNEALAATYATQNAYGVHRLHLLHSASAQLLPHFISTFRGTRSDRTADISSRTTAAMASCASSGNSKINSS